jgi:hypothetical protein
MPPRSGSRIVKALRVLTCEVSFCSIMIILYEAGGKKSSNKKGDGRHRAVGGMDVV